MEILRRGKNDYDSERDNLKSIVYLVTTSNKQKIQQNPRVDVKGGLLVFIGELMR